MVDQKMLLNLLLLVLTSVAAVGGSVNVMENYEEHEEHEEHPEKHPKEEEKENFYQYVKKREEFQNVNNANASMNANAPSNVMESFQAQVAPMNNVSPQANASMNNASTVEGFTGGSFAAF